MALAHRSSQASKHDGEQGDQPCAAPCMHSDLLRPNVAARECLARSATAWQPLLTANAAATVRLLHPLSAIHVRFIEQHIRQIFEKLFNSVCSNFSSMHVHASECKRETWMRFLKKDDSFVAKRMRQKK